MLVTNILDGKPTCEKIMKDNLSRKKVKEIDSLLRERIVYLPYNKYYICRVIQRFKVFLPHCFDDVIEWSETRYPRYLHSFLSET